MAIVIGQIITETAVAPVADAPARSGAQRATDEAQMDVIVRRASERVLEELRREWDR